VHVQDRFVEERDHRECCELDVFSGIASTARFLGRSFDGFADLMTKTLGIGDVLPVGAQALANGQYFLETISEVLRPAF
jgi:hypothetical protein